MKTKALSGRQSLFRLEELKAHVGTMSFGDKKINACVDLKGLLRQK